MITKIVLLFLVTTLSFSCTKEEETTSSDKKSPMISPVRTAQQKESQQAIKKFKQMQNKAYTPDSSDLSPEGFNWIHRDLALIYSRTLYEKGLQGLIHEDKLKNKSAALDAYILSLQKISRADFKKWSTENQLSFLINAYHSHMLKFLISENFKSLEQKLMDRQNSVLLFSQSFSFNKFITDEIQAVTQDPRVFMSLYCFASDCPEFRNRIYNYKNLENMLQVSTTRFFMNEDKNKYDSKSKILRLSSWVKRFRSQFPEKDEDYFKFLISYLSKNKNFPKLDLKKTSIVYGH